MFGRTSNSITNYYCPMYRLLSLSERSEQVEKNSNAINYVTNCSLNKKIKKKTCPNS